MRQASHPFSFFIAKFQYWSAINRNDPELQNICCIELLGKFFLGILEQIAFKPLVSLQKHEALRGQRGSASMMVGRAVSLNIDRPDPSDPKPRLVVDGLTVRDSDGVIKLSNISFTANSGEILGIAGISGCGQKELLEAIAGLQPVESGTIVYNDFNSGKQIDLLGKNAREIRSMGVSLSFVPEDRLGMGLVGNMVKLNPLKVYGAMWNGAFGTATRSWVTIRDTMMMLCIGIGLAPAFKMRFWNIGAEGQILVGGIATSAVLIYCGSTMPTWALLLVSFVASTIAGAIWGFIPAIFKARYETNETLFTLMMNYVAIQLTSFCVAKWEHPFGSNVVGVINQSTKAGWFPHIFGQQYVLNVILVMVLAVFMSLFEPKRRPKPEAIKTIPIEGARKEETIPVSVPSSSVIFMLSGKQTIFRAVLKSAPIA